MRKEYVVKPENKIVIAKLMLESRYKNGEILREALNECSTLTKDYVITLIQKFSKLNTSNRYNYKGIAKCDEFDTFDEKTGKKIAINKAESKYHKDMIKKYEKLALIFKKAATEMYTLEIKHLEKLKENQKNIQEYYHSNK